MLPVQELAGCLGDDVSLSADQCWQADSSILLLYYRPATIVSSIQDIEADHA